jgi:hypothetical protein
LLHAPPSDVTLAFVEYGKVRALPLTAVSETVGAVVSRTIVWLALVPVLPAMSPWAALTEYVPGAVRLGAVG